LGIAHWDDVGSSRTGASRIELAPGEQRTPPHVHGESEEIFYVLGGSGLTLLDDDAYEIRAGDCIVCKNSHETHTIRAGDDGLDVIAFGARVPELAWPESEAERPPTIVNTQDVEADVRGGRRRRDLGRAAGSRWTGLRHIELDAGALSGPPHVHSAEEEIFVVLDGDGTLELTPSMPPWAEPEVQAVRKGSVVARPAGTGVAHAFRAGDSGMTLIAWGTRDPNDICWYPRSKKIFWRGVGVVGRIEQLDYWEGEELE
jgi:uncharacterized cupin superfamily protein